MTETERQVKAVTSWNLLVAGLMAAEKNWATMREQGVKVGEMEVPLHVQKAIEWYGKTSKFHLFLTDFIRYCWTHGGLESFKLSPKFIKTLTDRVAKEKEDARSKVDTD